MSGADLAPLLTFLGIVVGAVVTFYSVRSTGRQAQRVSDASADATTRRDAVDGFDKLTARLTHRLEDLEERVTSLESDLADVNQVLKVAVGFIERLLDYIIRIAPGNKGVPVIPGELEDRLNPFLVSYWDRHFEEPQNADNA